MEQKEEINIQPEQNEEQEFTKIRRGLGTSGTTLNVPISESKGCQKEKRKSKKLKTYLKKYEGELPQSGKEIDFQEVKEAQRVPKKLDSRRNTSRHIIITLPKSKGKERILKAAREKETVTYQGVPIRLSSNFSKENRMKKKEFKKMRRA